MTELVLVLLALIWIAVLVPPWVRGLREGRPGDSISSFRRQLNVLERSSLTFSRSGSARQVPTMRNSAMPMGSARFSGPSPMVRQRRRQIVLILGGAFTVLLVLALVSSSKVMVAGAVIVGVLLVGYVVLLAQLQRVAALHRPSTRYRSAA